MFKKEKKMLLFVVGFIRDLKNVLAPVVHVFLYYFHRYTTDPTTVGDV